mmetsp:Transcript_23422/g.54528  ORF Transcript_23422/g.54528 Transcript_23422/m.54528 type:complete len:594 (-) Transcript_23422:167-1948(-)
MAPEPRKVGRDVEIVATVERYDVVDSNSNTNSALMGAMKARLTLSSTGQHVVFTINVECLGQQWQIYKRFSEVASLHETLAKKLPSMPELPAKSTVRHFSPEYCESRKTLLSAYLNDLVSRRDVCNCKETWHFFGLGQQQGQLKQEFLHAGPAPAVEPVQVAEVHDNYYGIVDFVFSQGKSKSEQEEVPAQQQPDSSFLVMGASDNSWAARVDNKVTKKLDGTPAPISQMTVWKQAETPGMRFEVQAVCCYSTRISCVALLRSSTGNGEAGGWALCGLSDGTVGWHDLRAPGSQYPKKGSHVPSLRHSAGIVAMAVNAADKWIMTASRDNALKVYDLAKEAPLCEVATPEPVASMFFSEKAKRLFTGLQNGKICVWDASTYPITQLCIIAAHPDVKIAALDFDELSNTLYAGSKEGVSSWEITHWGNSAFGRTIGQTQPVATTPSAMAWMSSSREVAAGFQNGTVAVLDLDVGKASFVFEAHSQEVTQVCWLDSSRQLLTSSTDKTLKIWDFPSLVSTADFLEGEGKAAAPVTSVIVSTAPETSPTSKRASVATPAATRGQMDAAAKPKVVVGAAPDAVFEGDSDDDLAGWDR